MILLRPPFLVGVALHILLIFTRIDVLSMKCVNGNCNGLVVADLPFSLMYLSFPDWLLILCSFVIGSLLWGVYGFGFYAFLKKVVGD
ncbi:MAG: hypothetical protein H3C43_00365 [Leptonema sp. (in: Bacteria)]|nr:hypothetical protein [Leptonema sp. (in: bacteria)]